MGPVSPRIQVFQMETTQSAAVIGFEACEGIRISFHFPHEFTRIPVERVAVL